MYPTKVCQLCLKLMEYLLRKGKRGWESSTYTIVSSGYLLIFFFKILFLSQYYLCLNDISGCQVGIM